MANNDSRRGGFQIRLLMIGEGPLEDRLRVLAEEERVQVEWTPVVSNSDLPRILERAKVFALVSLYEGHPKVLLEAMAMGMAVVGSRIRGTVEEIEDGFSGVLCDVDPESIADSLLRTVGSPRTCSELGLRAREHVVSRYALQHVVELECDLLERTTNL